MMTPVQILIRDRDLINRSIRYYLGNITGPRKLKEAVEYSVLSGGKRIRPILVLESARMCGGSIKSAVPFACAVEFIHNFSLIHDDLPAIDDDDVRRERPTCHRKFGEATAILAGDFLLNYAFEIMSSTRHRKVLEIIHEITKSIGSDGMIGGQLLDIEYGYNKKSRYISKKGKKEKIDTMKTAALMMASCKIGGLIGGGNRNQIRHLYNFGRKFGMAFQIADDIKDQDMRKKELFILKENLTYLISEAKSELLDFGKRKRVLEYISESLISGLEKVLDRWIGAER